MKKKFRKMDSTGDTVMEFDTEDKAATDEARALFEKLTSGASAVFAVNRGEGQQDKKVSNFEELEADNIVVPAIVGG